MLIILAPLGCSSVVDAFILLLIRAHIGLITPLVGLESAYPRASKATLSLPLLRLPIAKFARSLSVIIRFGVQHGAQKFSGLIGGSLFTRYF